jgi:CHASE2 domain-containing sensor protein
MRKKGRLWDVVVGSILTLVVAIGYQFPQVVSPLRGFELKFYDWRSQFQQTLDAGHQVVLIAIDSHSISKLGRWPWPRYRTAELLEKLKNAHPKVVGLDFVYSRPEESRGLKEIRSLSEDYQKLVSSREIRDRRSLFETFVASASSRLDSDSRLLKAIKESGNVVLPLIFTGEGSTRLNPSPLPPAFSSSSVHLVVDPELKNPVIPMGFDVTYPIVSFAAVAAGIGQANLKVDFDGVLRRVAPVMRYGDMYIPAYSLALVLEYMGIKPADVVFSPGKMVGLGKLKIPLNSASRMMIAFNGPYKTFRYYSFQDVIGGRVDMGVFKDKIVLVGPTAAKIATLYPTPISPALPALEILANITENILDGRAIERPLWAAKLEWSLIGAIGLFIIFALPSLSAFWGFALSLLILISLMGLGAYFFILGQWIEAIYPAALLVMGYLFRILRRFFVAERGFLKQVSDGAGVSESPGPPSKGTVPIATRVAKPTFGHYAIEKELGREAMGVVYLGRDPKINRWVAIKTMTMGEGSDETSAKEIKERFIREAELASQLNHPNIIQIFDAGEANKVVYVAMELLEGHSLLSYTEKARLLPAKIAMEYAAIVAEALDYAHRQGIVHRDITPTNIMILKDSTLRIANFGMARITSSLQTATGTVMGAPVYMSPEQAAGKQVDGRSDIFSLSVVLFELLTGEKPFKGGDGIGALLFQIVNDPHPDPLALAPKLPSCVSVILSKGLAKNPNARYQNGLDMARDIRACAGLMEAAG